MVRPKRQSEPIPITNTLVVDSLVDGLLPAQLGSIWHTKPVSVNHFIFSPRYLGLTKDIVRPNVEKAIYSMCDPKIREIMLIWGRGSGKTFASSIVQAHGIYNISCMADPQRTLGLAPGTPIYFVNTARNARQAKDVLFADFVAKLEHSQYFQEVEFEPTKPGEYQRLAQEIRFFKNIHALCANSAGHSWLGFHILQFICDELCFYRVDDDDESSESTAHEIWDSLIHSCLTHGNFIDFYKAIGISSPRFEDDFGMTKLRELKNRQKSHGDCFAMKAATWDMDPVKHPKSSYTFQLARNYNRTMRDVGAVPMESSDSFFEDPEIYKNNVTEGKINGYDVSKECLREDVKAHDTPLHIHFDLSLKKDYCGVYGSHYAGMKRISDEANNKTYELPVAEVDFGITIKPKERSSRFVRSTTGEVNYAELVQFVREVLQKGYKIDTVSFDRFQSAFIKQQLEDMDIEVTELSVDKDDVPATLCKEAIADRRIVYFYDEEVDRQIHKLQWVKGKKVDHPKHGFKDTWDGFCGSAYRILNAEEEGEGAFEFVTFTGSELDSLIGED